MGNKITLDSAYKFEIASTGDGSEGSAANYTIKETGQQVYDWYNGIYSGWWMTYPGYGGWTQVQFVDTTKKAMEIAKELMDRKLVTMRNVKDFIDLVDIIRKKIA